MTKQSELPWISAARKYVGLREDTSKTKHNPTILMMLKKMGSFNGEARAWWNNDDDAWCGTFVGYCLGISNRWVVREWYRAKSWNAPVELTKLDKPAYGAIVTFTRTGGGHVGFVVGKDKHGNIMVLGGNQSNKVSIIPFAPSRVTGYYWASKVADGLKPELSTPLPDRYILPLLDSDGKVSTNEG